MPYLCPKHNKQMIDGNYGPYCPTKTGEGPKDWCRYDRSPEFKAILAADKAKAAAPAAAPVAAPAAQPVTAPGSPRLEAAMAALEAMARVHQGTQISPSRLMSEAALVYHKFLKPTFFGELPEPRPEPQPEYASAPDYAGGPDDDIPF